MNLAISSSHQLNEIIKRANTRLKIPSSLDKPALKEYQITN